MRKTAVINEGKEILFVDIELTHLKGNKSPYFGVTGETWERDQGTGDKKRTGLPHWWLYPQDNSKGIFWVS